MNNKYRGYALIFNHQKFAKSFEERRGTDVDCDRLEKCLTALDFQVFVFKDLIKLDVLKTLEECKYAIYFVVFIYFKILVSQKDHLKNDCFLVAVLTHGDKGKLYAHDQDYKYEDLWNPFYSSHCPSLKGKPKIFIIQACQGKLYDQGVKLDRNFNNNSHDEQKILCCKNDLVDDLEDSYFPYQPVHENDFLIAFSTQPGKNIYTGCPPSAIARKCLK